MADPVPTDNGSREETGSQLLSGAPLRRRHLLRWTFKYSGYAATAASALWTGLLVLVAKNEINLVVWVERQTTIYPSEASMHLSLPLTFEGTPAYSVRTAALKISNYGKTTIGVPASTWTLIIEAPTTAYLRIINTTRVQPNGTVAVPRAQPRPNAVALDIGAFQPRASIDIIVLLVNEERAVADPVLRAIPTLAGLPRELSPKSPQERVQERLVPAAFALMLLLACFAFLPLCKEDFRRMRATSGPNQDTELPGKRRSMAYVVFYFSCVGAVVLLLAGLTALAISHGLAYIVSYTL